MNHIRFQSLSPQQVQKKQPGGEGSALATLAFSGERAATVPLEAVKASFAPVLFSGKTENEESLVATLREIGVPELIDVLENAKELAKSKGHAEVTALHVLAAQFNQMLSDVNKGRSKRQTESAVIEQLKDERSLWAANLGLVAQMSTPGELLIHLQRAATKVNRAVLERPKASVNTENPQLSRALIDVIAARVNQIKEDKHSEDDIHAMTEDMVQMDPRAEGAIKMMRSKLDEVDGFLRQTASDALELIDQFAPIVVAQYAQLRHLKKIYAEMKHKVDNEGLDPKELSVPMTRMGPEGPSEQSLPYAEIPQVIEEMEQRVGMMHAQAGLRPKKVETKPGSIFAALDGGVQGVAQPAGPELKELDQIPDDIMEMAGTRAMMQSQREMLEGQISDQREKAADNIREEMAEQIFYMAMTSAYSSETAPKHLEDNANATARRIYTNLENELSGDMMMKSESPERYLERATQNGASDAEIRSLQSMIRTQKRLSYMLSMGRNGRGGPNGEGGEGPGSMGSMAFLRDMQLVNNLMKAFSQINWTKVKNKKVDLEQAKARLDKNRLIPPPVRVEIMNFLKRGNDSGWTGQPLLMLVGGYGTAAVKKAVIDYLKDVLPMNYYEATGHHSGKIMGGGMGMLMRENQLSVPAKALLHEVEAARQNDHNPNPSPSTIVNLGNLINFLQNGGGEQLEAFMTHDGRANFTEPELDDVAMDLRPFVFVASIEDQMALNYVQQLYGQRDTLKDWTMISLGEDIDIYTKIHVAENIIAPKVQARYNVEFEPGAVKNIVTHWSYLARHGNVEDMLEEAAKIAAGRTASTDTQVVPADIRRLETEFLGPSMTTFLNKPMKEDTVGSVNALAAIGLGGGTVMRMGIYSNGTFSRKKEGGQLVKMTHALGPIGDMAKDSSVKATELLMATVANVGNTLNEDGPMYKAFEGMKKGHKLIVNWKENVDGPSAGAAMATAAISRMTGIPVRHDVAMTGTIADGLEVGEIGGIYNKVAAAHVAGMTSGIKKILMPRANHTEILFQHPKFVAQLAEEGVTLVPVDTIDDVLKNALVDYDRLHQAPPAELAEEEPSDIEQLLEGIRAANAESTQSILKEAVPAIVAAVLKQLGVTPGQGDAETSEK